MSWVDEVRAAINWMSDEGQGEAIKHTENALQDDIPADVKDYLQRAKSALEDERETNQRALGYLEAALRAGGEVP